jgi:hypothetical protein
VDTVGTDGVNSEIQGAADELKCETKTGNQDWDARRLLRALKKVPYDRLRGERAARKVQEQTTTKIRIYVTLSDQVGIEHLKPRIGRREVYDVELGACHKLRKKLIWKFRLKGLNWNLWMMSGGA